MSDEKNDPKARKNADAVPAPKGVSIMVLILTAVVAAGTAGGAALFVSKRMAHQAQSRHAAAIEAPPAHAAPGFTLPLEPFVVMCVDRTHSFHAMRTTLALEFSPTSKEDEIRPYIPRMRDAALTLLRSTTYEIISDPAQMDHIRSELQSHFQATGVQVLVRVLITDLVVQ